MRTGEIVLDLLKRQGKKQSDLARYLKVGTSTVHGWKQENRNPSAELIIPLSGYFNVPIDYLLTGNEKYINKKENGIMTRELYNSLCELQGVFKRLHTNPLFHQYPSKAIIVGDASEAKKDKEQEERIKQYYEKNSEEKQNEKLAELGVTKEELKEWSKCNFDNPPTENQLKAMVNYYCGCLKNDAEREKIEIVFERCRFEMKFEKDEANNLDKPKAK